MHPRKLVGLTEEEKAAILAFEKGGPHGRQMAEWNRLLILATRAFEELKSSSYAIYMKVAVAIRTDASDFYKAVNEATVEYPDHIHRTAESELPDAMSMVCMRLLFPDAFDLRAAVIDWLGDKPESARLVELLHDAQELWPKEE